MLISARCVILRLRVLTHVFLSILTLFQKHTTPPDVARGEKEDNFTKGISVHNHPVHCVCCVNIKLVFPLIYIQHNQRPCRRILERRALPLHTLRQRYTMQTQCTKTISTRVRMERDQSCVDFFSGWAWDCPSGFRFHCFSKNRLG